MSSLAATQADGYYRPSDWDGKASLNKITGSKGRRGTGPVCVCMSRGPPRCPDPSSLCLPLTHTGHNQWLKDGVIRFELPYTSVCTKCESYMGKGVRFNAKKVDVRVAWHGCVCLWLKAQEGLASFPRQLDLRPSRSMTNPSPPSLAYHPHRRASTSPPKSTSFK